MYASQIFVLICRMSSLSVRDQRKMVWSTITRKGERNLECENISCMLLDPPSRAKQSPADQELENSHNETLLAASSLSLLILISGA